MTQFFRQMLRDRGIAANILAVPPKLQEIHQKGWSYSVVRNDDIYFELPTPLHYSYISWLLQAPAENIPQANALQFTIEVVKRFSPSRIFSANGHAGPIAETTRTPEVQYQDEYYRASYDIAFGGVRTSPEFATGKGTLKAGRIDFLVAGPKWGIEITRDGNRLQEHSARFGSNGAYGRLVDTGEMSDYILLDCRTTVPRKSHPGIVVCA
jgi:hypothetical protein